VIFNIIRLFQVFSDVVSRTVVQQLTRFQLTRSLRRSSAIAEALVREHQLVTDGRTDRHRAIIYHTSIALLAKAVKDRVMFTEGH